jgi:hypothetical protein
MSELTKNPELYVVGFFELLALTDFDYTTASRRQLFDNCLMTVIGEGVLAEIADAYGNYGMRTTSGVKTRGCNRDEPLAQALHLPRKVYCW